MNNLYETLGVKRDADQATIKAAYRKLAQKHHPDREGGSSEAFQQIQDAYDVLKDADRRSHYDRTGETKVDRREEIMVATLLFELIQENNFIEENYIEQATLVLKRELNRAKSRIASIKKKRSQLNKILKNIKSESPFFADFFDAKCAELNHKEAVTQNNIDMCNKAIAILGGMKYTGKKKPPTPSRDPIFDEFFSETRRRRQP